MGGVSAAGRPEQSDDWVTGEAFEKLLVLAVPRAGSMRLTTAKLSGRTTASAIGHLGASSIQ